MTTPEDILLDDADARDYLSRRADSHATFVAICAMSEADRFNLAASALEHRAGVVTAQDVERFGTVGKPSEHSS